MRNMLGVFQIFLYKTEMRDLSLFSKYICCIARDLDSFSRDDGKNQEK